MTEQFALDPLRIDDAPELAPLLGDARLYEHIGGPPPSEQDLRERFARQVAGPPAGGEAWLNWVVRLLVSGEALGTVQATVGGGSAELAWVVGASHQGGGVAVESARAVVAWLRSRGVPSFTAHIGPANAASAAVARRIGMTPTCVVRDDGERRWELGY